jgi:hypothetical protein
VRFIFLYFFTTVCVNVLNGFMTVASYSAEEIDAAEFVREWKQMAEVLRAQEEQQDDLVSALEGFGKSETSARGGTGIDETMDES